MGRKGDTSALAPQAVHVRVLGPFGLDLDDVATPVARDQVKRVLTLLATRQGEPASPDQLIEFLWSDKLPTNPRASLRVALSRTRSTLGPHSALLSASGAGYLLDCSSDLELFEADSAAAFSAGTASQRIPLWRSALERWGDTSAHALHLGELTSVIAETASELRWQSMVACAEDLVELAQHEEAVALVLPLARAFPDRERVAIVAARALAALGRKAEGLQLLETVRSELRNKLGISPGDSLLEAEESILRGSIDLKPHHRPKSVADRLPFIGRDAERHALRDTTGPGLHVVLGDPGTGKTRLLQTVRSDIEPRPAVLFAESTPTPQRPMEALTEILLQLRSHNASTADDPALATALQRLSPGSVSASPLMVAPQTREALLSLVIDVLSRHASADDYVLMLDDCQWLDRSSAEVIEYLVQMDACRLVLASRKSYPDYLHFLTERTQSRFVLEGLSYDEVQALRDAASATVRSPVMDDLHIRTGGNPLFLSLLVRAADEGIETKEEIPTTVLMAVQTRVSALPLEVQQTMQVASVFQTDIDIDLLEQLRPGARGHVSQMAQAGLFTLSANESFMRFAHVLVAEALYQMLSPGQRVDLHDQLGRLLEDTGRSAASWAIHSGEAASFDPHRAVRAHIAAAAEFQSGFAWDTMLLHVQQARAHINTHNVDDARLLASLDIAEGTARRALTLDGSDPLLLAGTRTAHKNQWQDLTFTGLIELCSHGRIAEYDPIGEEILAIAEWLLTQDLSQSDRAKMSAAVSTLVNGSLQWQRGLELYRAAFDIAERAEDADLDAHVLLRLDLGLCHPDDFEKRRSGARRLAAIAGSDPDLRWEAAFLEFGFAQVMRDGSLENHLEVMRELTPQVRLRSRDFGMAFSEAAYAKYRGDLDRADELTNTAIAVGRERYTEAWVMNVCGVVQMAILEARDQLALILPAVDQQLAAPDPKPYWYAISAAAAAAAGDLDRARTDLDVLAKTNFMSLIQDLGYSAQLAMAARAACALKDHEAAAMLYGLLHPFAGRMVWNGVCVHRPVDDVLDELDESIRLQ